MPGCLRIFGAILVVLLLGPARSAHADGADSRRTEEHTTYTFEDEQVLAGSLDPLGEVLHVRRTSQRGSLVRARESFVPELLQSVEAL